MRLEYSLDEGIATRAAIGLIVLQADETFEPEALPLLLQEGVAVYTSRIPSAPEVTPETLARMKAEMPRAASLLPAERALDVVAYCCTSGATVIGPEQVARSVQLHHPHAVVTNPLTALIAACRHLGITKLGLVTPYVPSVSSALRDQLEDNGISIVSFGSFEQEEETAVARIDAQSVKQAICQIGAAPEVEAVFASCTNLRTFSIIEPCEEILDKPVLSSNLVLAWHILAGAGLESSRETTARLFASPVACPTG